MSYQRLSAAAKEALTRDRAREPATHCPDCEAQVMPQDLLSHAERCPGPRPPHPHSRWVTHREVMRLGVPRWTLSRWVAAGKVRTEGPRRGRRYLLRDVVRQAVSRRVATTAIDKSDESGSKE